MEMRIRCVGYDETFAVIDRGQARFVAGPQSRREDAVAHQATTLANLELSASFDISHSNLHHNRDRTQASNRILSSPCHPSERTSQKYVLYKN